MNIKRILDSKKRIDDSNFEGLRNCNWNKERIDEFCINIFNTRAVGDGYIYQTQWGTVLYETDHTRTILYLTGIDPDTAQDIANYINKADLYYEAEYNESSGEVEVYCYRDEY